MPTLALVRHGQSLWNLENRFTGWVDVPLTADGEAEARRAGQRLTGQRFDVAYTSSLVRAQETLRLLCEEAGLDLPVIRDEALNERHYGDLQGLNKAETAARYGDEQVHIWRRSFDTPPPPMEASGPSDLASDRRYAGIAIPDTESLKDTIARVLPYWEASIAPVLKAGQRVVISAHGNSLRALVKHLSGISDEEIVSLEIPTGQPIVYELDHALTPTDRYYLSER